VYRSVELGGRDSCNSGSNLDAAANRNTRSIIKNIIYQSQRIHRLLISAQKRWPAKQLWVTETSGPPTGWQQTEWFWWMLAETRLAAMGGVNVPVFIWAPAISMYDWVDET
jgi:hypothetical protein